eukprot:3745887-Amphidinium_carterae.1
MAQNEHYAPHKPKDRFKSNRMQKEAAGKIFPIGLAAKMTPESNMFSFGRTVQRSKVQSAQFNSMQAPQQ